MRSLKRHFSRNPRLKGEHVLYTTCGPAAEATKITLQFLIGIGLTLLLLAKLIPPLMTWHYLSPAIKFLVTLPTLELVGIALAYSSGFELAYTLFTAGPDEAVEPVIMGLAAAMLLGFSKLEKIDLLAGCGAVAFVLALAGLFIVRQRFLNS